MRRTHNPKKFILLLAGSALFALCLPAIRSNLYKAAPYLQKMGERLALFAACSELPHESLGLLERRFSDRALQEGEGPQSSFPPPAPPAPESPSAPESAASPQGEPPADSSSGAQQAEQGGEQSSRAPEEATSSEAASKPQEAGPEPPDIPAPYRGDMLEEDLSGHGSKNTLSLEPGYLRNYTDYSYSEIGEILSTTPSFSTAGGDGPQVLIYHTHATEAFERYDHIFYDTRNNWRSTDNNMNMVAVGDALATSLEAQGIRVLHDTTQHDYPSYNGAYERSAETVNRVLEEYPSIQIILDVHRDAIDRNGTLIRPIAEIEGRKAAQLMVIAGCDDGTMDMPNWRENLRFAAMLQRQVEAQLPGLMRPLFFGYRKYNQNLRPGALLMEFGSHGNTLEECIYTAQLIAPALARVIRELE